MKIPSVKDAVSEQEWDLRVNLAACYRLVAMYGWTDLVFTHISARIPGPDHHFLINPYGLMFDEITASSLVKVDLGGTKIVESPFPISPAGFLIHSTIHEARVDAGCVLHTHSRAGVGVSCQKSGLRLISQQSTFIMPDLAYHGYEGLAVREEERPRLVTDLGTKNYFMLRNHGLLVVGKDVPDAFLRMYFFETACRVQIDALAGGSELLEIPRSVLSTVEHGMKMGTQGQGGDFAWPALIRRLDRIDSSYKT